MFNALLPAGLPTQPHHGEGARWFHRIGGAVRRVFAGVTTPRTSRHPAAPSGLTEAACGTADSPTLHCENLGFPTPPRRPHVPRRRPAAPSEAPPVAQSVAQPEAPPVASTEAPPEAQPRRGWFSRWFGRRRRQAALSLPPFPPFSDSDSDYEEDNTPFTPENHPGLSPEICDFFNTRIDDCDPEMLHVVLAVIATLVAESLPPELRTDPRAIVADIWDRLREPGDETTADATPDRSAENVPDSMTEAAPGSLTEAAPDTQPYDALANLADAAPDEQPGDATANLAETAPDTQPGDATDSWMATAPDEPPGDAPASPDDAMPEASPPPPAPLPQALMAIAPDSIAVAVADAPSYPAALPRPDHHGRAHHRHRSRLPGHHGRVPDHASRWRLRGCRSRPRLGRRDLPSCPPPRRLCYAACAGPP